MDAPQAFHHGDGALNVNSGAGKQVNYTLSGGTNNQQFNANILNYTERPALPERRETPPLPDSTNVPFPPDPHFVERPELAQLEQAVSSVRRRAALTGLGGVGKSQLAIEYCHRLREQSPETWVLWLHASHATRFDADMRKLANDVKIFGRKDPKADIFQLTYDWLRDSSKGKWVLVVDNADDADFLLTAAKMDTETGSGSDAMSTGRTRIQCLPMCKHGAVIITSRSRAMAAKLIDESDIIEVQPMAAQEAHMLLEKRTGYPADSEGTRKLAAALEYIPLAIAQAAAYIKKRRPRFSIQRYLAELEASERSMTSLLEADSGEIRRDSGAANSILATWQISFEHMSHSRASAAELLSLMSFFDHQDIPEYLVKDSKEGEPPDLSFDPEFEEDIVTLRDYHFITVARSGATFRMHRLVQVAARKWLVTQGQHQRLAERSIRKLDGVLPEGKYENWHRCRELSSHARLILELRVDGREVRRSRASILYKVASFLWRQGSAEQAQTLAEEGVRDMASLLGEQSREAFVGEAILAIVLQEQGKYEQAEAMYRRVLVSMENELGAEDLNTLGTLNNLALVMRCQGKYEAAEDMSRKALAGREKVLGAEHPATLICLTNLAGLLLFRDKYEQAEDMSRQALAGMERTLGAEHPDTLTASNFLTVVLLCQKKYDVVEESARQTVASMERILGVDHPSTLTALNNLGASLQAQGKYEQAEVIHRRVLASWEKSLGPDHSSTKMSARNLTLVLLYQGKDEAAEEVYERLLAGTENEMEAEKAETKHEDTPTSISNPNVVLHY